MNQKLKQRVASDAKETAELETASLSPVAVKPRWPYLLAGIFVCCAAFAAWTKQPDAVAEDATTSTQSTTQPANEIANRPKEPLSVETLRIGQIRPVVSQQTYSGVLAAEMRSLLSFERAGRVVQLMVREGDQVKKGQVLATLDMSNLDAQTKRTRAELQAAEALLAERVAGPRPQQIQAAKARVASLQAKRKLAKSNLDRQRKLMNQNAGSDQSLDQAQFNSDLVAQELIEAAANLDELLEGTRAEQILSQRAIRDSIQARLAEIETLREDSKIQAPFSGSVSRRMIDPGSVISAGTTVFELMTESLEAQFGLPTHVAANLQVGDRVRVLVNGKSRDGVVDRFEPQVDAVTRTQAVYIRFPSEASRPMDTLQSVAESIPKFRTADPREWIAGEVASLLIPIDPISDQLRYVSHPSAESKLESKFWVPSASLHRAGRGLWTVMVAAGEQPITTVERRAVEVLKTQGDYSYVTGMIQSRERIVTTGLHRITAGMEVRTRAKRDKDSEDDEGSIAAQRSLENDSPSIGSLQNQLAE